MLNSECDGCKDEYRNCWIKNKVSRYSFGDCPCKTCLVKMTCYTACNKYNTLHTAIWAVWNNLHGNKKYYLDPYKKLQRQKEKNEKK